jgi:hypothetical protein
MPIETLTSYADLLAWLDEGKIPHTSDAATRTVEIPADGPLQAGAITVRWEARLPLAQIINEFIHDVPDDRVRAVETAIIRANDVNPLPGLGYDHARRVIYMRRAVPIYEGIREKNFRKQIVGVVAVARDFTGAFKAIVAGKPGESVMELALQDAQARQNAPKT